MIINKAFLIVTNAQHFENRQEVCDDIFNVWRLLTKPFLLLLMQNISKIGKTFVTIFF